MSSNEALSAKEEALTGIAASIASGCRPCTRRWLKAAQSTGACDRSIRLAIEVGLAVRAEATAEMADFADALQAAPPQVDDAFRAERTRLIEIFSCSAAIAVQSAVGLERHIDTARGYGATTAQLSTAVGIGRATRKMGGEQAEKVVARAELDATPAFAGNWCCDSLSTGSVGPEGGCGCGGQRS